MALSAFDDNSAAPTPRKLKAILGRSGAHWDDLVAHIASHYRPLDEQWNFPGPSWGWSLRLKQKKRAVLYMTPCKKFFFVGIVLGEKAVKAAHDSSLPNSMLTLIDQAQKYVEGRAIRLEVRSKKDCDVAKKLAAIKMAN